jgi:hypothetical protein
VAVIPDYDAATDCALTLFSVTDGDTVRVYRQWDGPVETCEVGEGLLMTEARSFRDNPIRHPRGLPARQCFVDTPEKGSPDYQRATADYAEWWRRYRGRIRGWVWDQGEGGFSRLLIHPYVAGEPDNPAARWMLTEANDGKGWPPYVKGQ